MVGFDHAPVSQNDADIISSFGDSGYAFRRSNAARSGIICRERVVDTAEFTELRAKVARSTSEISVKTVAINPELLCGRRHQLAETEGPFGADCYRIVATFLHEQRVHQRDRYACFASGVMDERI